MTNLKHRMKKVAGTRVPVLITGETGTGKDLVANAIHQASGSQRPFIAVDCGAIPDSLMEAELFGSAKGSFTDSKADRQGLIESADGGTLFLDEIGNMPLQLQAKLLRVLESGYVRRIGETIEREVDFRLISATNSDLSTRISSGEFRSDLYYRIAVMVLDVPPLRNRIEDIPLLVKYYASRLSEPDRKPPAFLKSSINRLCAYRWPGNVRELRNVIHRAILLSNGKIIRESEISFQDSITVDEHTPRDTSLQKLDDVVTKHVYRVYSKLKNKIRSAEVLDCDPKTVTKYIRRYKEKFMELDP
jgi:DNA-binding NtrC family response regulator